MPTYQYQCTECGEDLEAVQKFSDSPLTECPTCNGRLRKVFSAVGIVFKGSGFYRTDSRSSSSIGSRPAKEHATAGADAPSANGSAKKDGATAKAPATSSTSAPASAGSSAA